MLIKELFVDDRTIWGSIFFLQIEVWSADRRIIRRWNNYLQIEELSEDRITICRLKKFTDQRFICRPRKYQHIEELSVDWRITWILKKYLETKQFSACWCSICKSKNCPQIKEPSVDPRIIWGLKNYMQIEARSADQSFQFFNLLIFISSADSSLIRS